MNSDITLSVVIPFYNGTEEVLAFVGELADDNSGYEILIVDDGSTDCSPEEIEQRVAFLSNVSVVAYRDNRGVSGARNAGIFAARGRYIWLVDADDTITRGAIRRMVEWIEGSQLDFDVLFFQHCADPRDLDSDALRVTEMSKDNALRRVYEFDGYVWNKLFRRAIIVGNNLRFDEQICWAEDKLFCAQYIIRGAGRCLQTTAKLYCHRRSEGSFTSSKAADKKHLSLLDSKRQLLDLARLYPIDGLADMARDDLVVDSLMILYRVFRQRPSGWREDWAKYWGWISAYRDDYLGSPSLSVKHRIFLRFCPLIGAVVAKTKEGAA